MSELLKMAFHNRAVLWTGLAVILVTALLTGAEASSETMCVNGQCVVRASINPSALIPSALALVLILCPGKLLVRPVPTGIIRKRHLLIAWIIDFFLITFALVPLAAAAPLFVEALHTGEWATAFERDFMRASDAISVLVTLGTFAAVVLYLGRGGLGRGPTLGQYLMHFEAKVGPSIATWRRVMGLAFLPAQIILRPIEAKIGIRRAPALSFVEVELMKIE